MMKYVVIVDYESDAERKRIDYVVERWMDKLDVSKLKGVILGVNGDDLRLNTFLEDLYSRLEVSSNRNLSHKIRVYRVGEYHPEIEGERIVLKYDTKEDIEIIRKFVGYLMAKLNASYEYSSRFSYIYRAYTKKGWVRIEIRYSKKEKTEITITIEGYGEVVNFIADKIDREMKSFLGGG